MVRATGDADATSSQQLRFREAAIADTFFPRICGEADSPGRLFATAPKDHLQNHVVVSLQWQRGTWRSYLACSSGSFWKEARLDLRAFGQRLSARINAEAVLRCSPGRSEDREGSDKDPVSRSSSTRDGRRSPNLELLP